MLPLFLQSLDLVRLESAMTEIGQSVFELCERKEKVRWSVGGPGTYKLALQQTLLVTTDFFAARRSDSF